MRERSSSGWCLDTQNQLLLRWRQVRASPPSELESKLDCPLQMMTRPRILSRSQQPRRLLPQRTRLLYSSLLASRTHSTPEIGEYYSRVASHETVELALLCNLRQEKPPMLCGCFWRPPSTSRLQTERCLRWWD